eukprot:2113622-Alexandrium_andersonii.AAC.1
MQLGRRRSLGTGDRALLSLTLSTAWGLRVKGLMLAYAFARSGGLAGLSGPNRHWGWPCSRNPRPVAGDVAWSYRRRRPPSRPPPLAVRSAAVASLHMKPGPGALSAASANRNQARSSDAPLLSLGALHVPHFCG